TSVAAILELIKGLKFRKKKAAAFGCYGWSGESAKIISDSLESSGFEMVDDVLKVNWNPDDDSMEKCIAYGKEFAENSA
ncbi:MAG: FprA family A-type flavoprotein, partial [Deltaproteobacteria bacterium]